MALGMQEVELALFHCFIHAISKANIFIAIGVILFSRLGCQDVRSLNLRTRQKSPLAWSLLFISMVRMAGLPYFSVASSKEALLVAFVDGHYGVAL